MDLERLHSAYVLRRELAKVSTKHNSATPSTIETLQKNSKQDAALIEIGNDTTKAELYKHIEDTYNGKGYLSKDTGIKLNKEASKNFDTLSQEDPSASALYSAYMTAGFSYGSKARFISNINNTVKNSANIRKAYSSQKE